MSDMQDAIKISRGSECCSVNVKIQRGYMNHTTGIFWLDDSIHTNNKALEHIHSLSAEEVTNKLFQLVLFAKTEHQHLYNLLLPYAQEPKEKKARMLWGGLVLLHMYPEGTISSSPGLSASDPKPAPASEALFLRQNQRFKYITANLPAGSLIINRSTVPSPLPSPK